MIIPNFLIIGAARSGTTFFSKCIQMHKEIFIPDKDREPKFFSRESEYEKGINHYLNSYFSGIDRKKYKAVGEKSTEYMENLSSSERIFKFNPDIKLIAVMRHPVERVISNYWWSVYNKLENRYINEAIKEELKNYLDNPEKIFKIDKIREHDYIKRSLYFENLLPYYKIFDIKNIKCVFYEEMTNSPDKIFNDIFSFLNVQTLSIDFKKAGMPRKMDKSEKLDNKIYQELELFFNEKNKNLSDLIKLNIPW